MEILVVVGLVVLLFGILKKVKKLIGLGILVAVVAYALSYMGILNLPF